MKLVFRAALCVWLGTIGWLVAGDYYNAITDQRGAALGLALHELIKDHHSVSYDSLWEHYETTDATPDGKPWCIYSEFPFQHFKQDQGGKPGHVGSYLTREHSWPKGWWGGTPNAAYSDLFHVILGDADVNGQKGVKPLGETGADARVTGISKVGPARPGLGFSGFVFEPADRYKGDFARNYLYFAVRYLTGEGALDCSRSPMVAPNGELKPWAQDLLLKWNEQDPPDDRERRRNEAVFAIQLNRNPFIDHPEYARLIWGEPRIPWWGVDANYALEMEGSKHQWSVGEKPEDLFAILNQVGFDRFRIRIWVGEKGTNKLAYALETARRAQDAGLRPYGVMFLSSDWADYDKQPAPEEWRSLDFPAKRAAVEAYAERVARAFADAGIRLTEFEIGNEIDYGICGEFEADWAKRVSLPYLTTTIWPRAAELIAAAQRGIRRVNPEAKFILHLTQWWNPEFGAAFFATMQQHGATADYAGLSFFPTSNLCPQNSFDYFLKQTGALAKALDRKIVICETGYPSAAQFTGQFAEWNRPVGGYPLDEAGQAKWLIDFRCISRESGFIQGAFYWSPEWNDSPMWNAFSLFDDQGRARAALRSVNSAEK